MKRLLTFILVLGLTACGETTGPDDDGDPPGSTVSAVVVDAPNGAILDVGASAALTAEATDAAGAKVSATIVWSSSDERVATVASTGLVRAESVGRATITATADETPGSLEVRVVDADTDGLAVLLDDPFAEQLLDGLSVDVAAVWSECDAARAAGNLAEVETCLTELRAALDAESDPAGGPLRALVGLFADWMDRLLNLN